MLALLSILIVTVLGAAPAEAAARKPGLYGPTTVTAGEEVTFTSVFLAKDRKNICFAPDMEWGDVPPRPGIGICMKFGFSGKYEREVESFTHVFEQPGTYTVTVTAAGMSATGMPVAKPSLATVKGPRKYSRTITVLPPPQVAPTPTPAATPVAEVAP
jgi:plastocyanin